MKKLNKPQKYSESNAEFYGNEGAVQPTSPAFPPSNQNNPYPNSGGGGGNGNNNENSNSSFQEALNNAIGKLKP